MTYLMQALFFSEHTVSNQGRSYNGAHKIASSQAHAGSLSIHIEVRTGRANIALKIR
jgi:hypothetical protein